MQTVFREVVTLIGVDGERFEVPMPAAAADGSMLVENIPPMTVTAVEFTVRAEIGGSDADV